MDLPGKNIGSVLAVWRYPVKSMQGEQIDRSPITEYGLLGDRAYALLDRTTGHIASAKHPRKWQQLFACMAAYVQPPESGAPIPPIWITLPDGSVISSEQQDVDAILSRVIGRDVTLIADAPAAPTREANRAPFDADSDQETIREEVMGWAAPAGTFFDYAPLHLLTTATLGRLQDHYPAGRFDTRRFRPNIIVAPHRDEHDFIENTWLGFQLRIGKEAQLHIIDPSPRCVITTLAQGDLPHDKGILRAIAQNNAAASATLAPGVVLPAVAGVYAQVRRNGTVAQGDQVWIG